jgi:hypothetical protein
VNSRARERTLARVERLVTAGRGTDELMAEADELLAATLPHESHCWHTPIPTP